MELRTRGLEMPRRKVVAAGLAALAMAVPLAPKVAARIMLIRGMAGGGLVQLEGGDEPRLANLSLFASAMQLPEGTSVVTGSIRWFEAGGGLRLETTEVISCVPMEDRPDGAEIRGRMKVNGEGDYPFVVNVMDTDAPGAGRDAIRIEVNGPRAREGVKVAASDDEFLYEAAAALVAGDFQWLIVDREVDG